MRNILVAVFLTALALSLGIGCLSERSPYAPPGNTVVVPNEQGGVGFYERGPGNGNAPLGGGTVRFVDVTDDEGLDGIVECSIAVEATGFGDVDSFWVQIEYPSAEVFAIRGVDGYDLGSFSAVGSATENWDTIVGWPVGFGFGRLNIVGGNSSTIDTDAGWVELGRFFFNPVAENPSDAFYASGMWADFAGGSTDTSFCLANIDGQTVTVCPVIAGSYTDSLRINFELTTDPDGGRIQGVGAWGLNNYYKKNVLDHVQCDEEDVDWTGSACGPGFFGCGDAAVNNNPSENPLYPAPARRLVLGATCNSDWVALEAGDAIGSQLFTYDTSAPPATDFSVCNFVDDFSFCLPCEPTVYP